MKIRKIEQVVYSVKHAFELLEYCGIVSAVKNTELAKQAFRCAAPAVWNALPATVINSLNVLKFDFDLKRFYSVAFTISVACCEQSL